MIRKTPAAILKEWQYESEDRVWGKFYNLFTDNKVKLKELIVSPGKGMSLQKHFHRDEIWFVSKECVVNFSQESPALTKEFHLKNTIALVSKEMNGTRSPIL